MTRWFTSPISAGTPYGRAITIALLLGLLLAIGIMWASNRYFTAQFTEAARIDAAVGSTLHAGNIAAALERQSVVPLILSRDQKLIQALNSKDFANTSQHLISFLEEIEAANVMLVDLDGRTVAASDRRMLGMKLSERPYFHTALRQPGTAFTLVSPPEEQPGFYFSRRIEDGNEPIGILVVQADLQRLEDSWRRSFRQVFVADSEDAIILASNPIWKQSNIQDVIAPGATSPRGRLMSRFGLPQAENSLTYIEGTAFLSAETKIGFQGLKLTYFETMEGVRARVLGIVALELVGFTSLAAMALFFLNRASARQSVQLIAESAELRKLNKRLSNEITERKRAEENLQVAEQSLAQQSKLAALGQMSAAVSHELNQPLAAMRTYLAGARMLLSRNRTEEAGSSFQRIEDLLDRMGALTRQLKSFARKSDDDLQPVDLRKPLAAAFAMMAPQLDGSNVRISYTESDTAAMVMADELRIEQIIVNLFRNALDAMKGIDAPHLDVLVTVGDTVNVAVRDNGHGIEDADKLFEPFFTTKKPGEGIGLGLAISAGIASELGGSLTARNGSRGGAIFELQLPRLEETKVAAQ